MYHRGTLVEFNTWHDTAMLSEEIPTPEGKIGRVNDVPAPSKQRTTSYSRPIQNINLTDDYIWDCGKHIDNSKDVLTKDDAKAIGWFSGAL